MSYASEVKALLQNIDNWVAENPLPAAEGQKTGIGLLWVKLAQYIGDTQARSYALVFTIIAVLMCVSFGSIRVGLLSMIPNLAPVILALGVLGWSGIPLDYMKLLFATIAIGIAVDDTIHLVTRFRQRFHETGNYESAMRLGLTDVGPALVVTSIILVSAFAAYLLSNTVILAHMGVLLGGTIIAALITDLLLMPVLADGGCNHLGLNSNRNRVWQRRSGQEPGFGRRFKLYAPVSPLPCRLKLPTIAR